VAQLTHRAHELKRRGFDFKSEGPTTLLITAVPTLLAGRDLSALFSELAQDLSIAPGSEPTASNAEMTRLILATAACHAAVRAGEELPPAELRQLLAQARQVDFVHNCPHGRRVFKWWSNQQVAQWFDR
jgi:DNA mismatch repair protein MutL